MLLGSPPMRKPATSLSQLDRPLVTAADVALDGGAVGAVELGPHLLGTLAETGPGDRDLHAPAVLELHEPGGQIFHIVIRHLFGAEVLEGGAGNGGDLGPTHQVPGQVDAVHTQIDQRAAAGHLLAVEPADAARMPFWRSQPVLAK